MTFLSNTFVTKILIILWLLCGRTIPSNVTLPPISTYPSTSNGITMTGLVFFLWKAMLNKPFVNWNINSHRSRILAPSTVEPLLFSAKPQLATVDDLSPLPLSKIWYIKQTIGKLLFYARAIDLTMLHALNKIVCSASKGTVATLRATQYLLNYAAANPNTKIMYRASDMILRSYRDAAYLVAPTD